MRKNQAIPGRFLPQKNAKNSKRRSYDVSSLHCNPALQSDKVPQFREDSNTYYGRIFNAKSQRREGAKSFFPLGGSAASRLCVKRPLLYPWNLPIPSGWFNTFGWRLAALCISSLFSSPLSAVLSRHSAARRRKARRRRKPCRRWIVFQGESNVTVSPKQGAEWTKLWATPLMG
jgi:hypothetical protein